MRKFATFLLLGCALLVAPATNALAGNVYRCDTGDGSATYSSKRLSGASCKLVSSFKTQRAMVRGRAEAVTSSTRFSAVSLAPKLAAVGNATPPALITGSPVSASIQAGRPAAAMPPLVAPNIAAPRLIRGHIFSFIKDGVRTYTSARPRGAVGVSGLRTIQYSYMQTCYACSANPGVSFATVRLNTAAYEAEIAAAAHEQGVDEAIVRAIIHAESAFNPNALSRVGAQGLMQLMPATARRFGVSDAFNATQNISGGVKYLAWLLKRFNGNLSLAAAGYNAGEGAVDKYNGVPPYSETQRYVQRVGLLAERYRGSVATR
jgi:soluble lytic murein transglycosylase-like protein